MATAPTRTVRRKNRSGRRGSLVSSLVLILALPLSLAAACASTADHTQNPRPVVTSIDLPHEDWWGGPSYFAKFPQAASSGWTDPSFFPIAVFMGKPAHAASLRSIGVNTYMGAEHDGSELSSITSTGMFVLAQREWTPAEVGDDPRVVGWQLSDECDMGYSDCGETQGKALKTQERYAATARGNDDGRFLQANFGNGVLGTFWARDTMDDHVSLVDVTSVDKYAYTSPHVRSLIVASPHWPAGKKPGGASAYGWLQDRMESFSDPPGSKPNWVFIETAKPYLTEKGATTISGPEIEGAAWNAIIHGAAGIAYFQHNNNGTCGNYSLIDCPEARAAVTKLNTDITNLAPVLNTQPYEWNFGTGLDTTLKVSDGQAYIIAMTDGGTGSRTFTLPAAITGTTVEVVGENRTLTVTDNKFSDAFDAESTHHIYKVTI